MDYTEENLDRNKMLNLFAFLVENLCVYTQLIVRQGSLAVRRFVENLEIEELLEVVSEKLAEHPLLKFLVFASVISCTIPVVMFILFGIVSVIVTFAGFVFIEGTLLAIGGLCMFACITMMIMVLSVLALTSVAIYMLTLKLGLILNRFEMTSNILRSLAPQQVQSQTGPISSLTANSHQD